MTLLVEVLKATVLVTLLHDGAVVTTVMRNRDKGSRKGFTFVLLSSYISFYIFSLCKREADRNQELLTRIKQYQERETEAENKLKEQMEMNKSYKKSMETMSKKLQEKESKLAEANEVRTESFSNLIIASGDFAVLVY